MVNRFIKQITAYYFDFLVKWFMSAILCFQLLKCEDWQLFFVIYDCKLKSLFCTVG